MRQFDVYKNPSPISSKFAPYLLILQSSLTQTRTTVIAAPLLLPKRMPEKSRLFPAVTISGKDYILSTNALGAVHVSKLTERVTNVEAARLQVFNALDMLFKGS